MELWLWLQWLFDWKDQEPYIIKVDIDFLIDCDIPGWLCYIVKFIMVFLCWVVRIPNGKFSLKYSSTSNHVEIWLIMFGHVDFNSPWLSILTIIDHAYNHWPCFLNSYVSWSHWSWFFDMKFLCSTIWLIHNMFFIKIYVTLWHS